MTDSLSQTPASRADMLNMDYINSLPQPFFARKFGSDWWWPVNDFEVQTGLYRIDVMGKLDVCHINDTAEFRDGEGKIHDSADFYLEDEVSHV